MKLVFVLSLVFNHVACQTENIDGNHGVVVPDRCICNPQVIINPPKFTECSPNATLGCNCSTTRQILSSELEATNQRLEQLDTAISPVQGQLTVITESDEDMQHQLQLLQTEVANLTDMLRNLTAIVRNQT